MAFLRSRKTERRFPDVLATLTAGRRTVLTEPVMKVVTIVPDDYLGEVIGDFNSRRGQILAMEATGSGVQEISAYVPLSNMFGYATDLRSKTQGRGLYSMEPSHFAEVPKSIQETIIKERSKTN